MSHHTSSHASAHRRHPAYDARPAQPGVPSSTIAAQLIVAALSFAVLVGAAFHALGTSIGN
jgi:hypothetical protein